MLWFPTRYDAGQWIMVGIIGLVTIAAVILSIVNHNNDRSRTDPIMTPSDIESEKKFFYWAIWVIAALIAIGMLYGSLKSGDNHYWTTRAHLDLAAQNYHSPKKLSVRHGRVSFGQTGCLFDARLKKVHGVYHVFAKTADKKTPIQLLPAAQINTILSEVCRI